MAELSEGDFKKINDALKDSTREVQDFHDILTDVFDITKKVNSQYNKVYQELSKTKNEHKDISNQIISQQKEYDKILSNLENLNGELSALNAAQIDDKNRLEEINKLNLDRTKELQNQAEAEKTLIKLEESRKKNAAAIVINDKAVAENLLQQQGMAEKLKQIEKEMDDAQLQSIHDGIDLTEEYNALTAKREFYQKRLGSLMKTGNQYAEDGLKLEQRRLAIEASTTNAKNKLDLAKANIELIKEGEAIQERMALTDGQIATIQKNITGEKGKKVEIERSLSGLQKKRAELEEKMNKLYAQLNLVKLIKLAFERFVQLDAAAENFRKETGFSINQMKQLRKDAEALNVQFADMGVSIEKVYASAKALADVFGRTSLVTKEALQNVALLSANLGVAETDSASVLAMFQGLGDATEEAAMNVIKVGAGISEKAGVPFSMVMKDIANASEQTTALIGANPSKLMKSAIAARALGTDLNKIVSSQRKLLDFSSSINDELEVSALLGKSISFQKARQLAYEGNIEGAAKATLEAVKSAGDFDKMNVYQREALAKASGMELKDLTKMIAVDKQRSAIMNGADEVKKKQLLAQEAELENLKKIDDLNNDDLVKQNEKALMQQKMQGIMTRLKNLVESLTVAFADILEPIVTPLMEILVPVFKLLAIILKNTIVPVLKLIAFPIQEAVKAVQKLFDGFNEGKGEVTKTGEKVSEFFKFFESGWGYALKIIGGLAAGGLLGMMMFGKLGTGALVEKIKTPFKLLGQLGKKIPVIGNVFDKKDIASEGIDKVKNSSKSVPKGEGIKDFLTNLAAGLKEMGNVKVLFGAANLLIAAAPLAIIAPISLLVSVLGLVGKSIETGLKFLAKGIGYMGNSNVLKGALGIALVGASIIPFALAMQMFSDVDWTSVGIGALALIGFTAAAFGLGVLLSSGIGAAVFGAGVIGIAALGVALVPFGIAALAAGAGIKMLGDGISSSVDPIMRLSKIDLTTTAVGITAVGAALSAFGGGSVVAGIGSLVGKFLGGDPIEKMEKLAAIGDKLKVTADSITSISTAAAQFGAIDMFADAIVKLSESLVVLNASINKFDAENISKLSQITSFADGATSNTSASTATSSTGIESKLDELINLLKDGAIGVNIDGIKASKVLARAST